MSTAAVAIPARAKIATISCHSLGRLTIATAAGMTVSQTPQPMRKGPASTRARCASQAADHRLTSFWPFGFMTAAVLSDSLGEPSASVEHPDHPQRGQLQLIVLQRTSSCQQA